MSNMWCIAKVQPTDCVPIKPFISDGPVLIKRAIVVLDGDECVEQHPEVELRIGGEILIQRHYGECMRDDHSQLGWTSDGDVGFVALDGSKIALRVDFFKRKCSFTILVDYEPINGSCLKVVEDVMTDRLGNPYRLVDYEAAHIAGVQVGTLGHKLWVCVDGIAVLRVKSPKIEVEDMRHEEGSDTRGKTMIVCPECGAWSGVYSDDGIEVKLEKCERCSRECRKCKHFEPWRADEPDGGERCELGEPWKEEKVAWRDAPRCDHYEPKVQEPSYDPCEVEDHVYPVVTIPDNPGVGTCSECGRSYSINYPHCPFCGGV